MCEHRERGFSLVELLAVVAILVVLSSIAVPAYINSRKSAAARACLANISIIAAAESAWAIHNGSYNWDVPGNPVCTTAYIPGAPAGGGLVGAPEGLAASIYCPLDGTTQYTVTQTDATGNCIITCPNGIAIGGHKDVITNGNWTITLAAPAIETIP